MWTNLAPKAKAVIILGASSLVAGTGILIHDMSNAESIQDTFLSKKYSLIDNKEKWTEILKDYTAHVKEKKDARINNFEGGEGEEKIEEFKKKCETILKVKFRIGAAKKLISKALWCVKEQTILDYLTKNNYSIFKTDDTRAEEDNKKWDKKIKKYLNEDNKEKIPNLELEKIKGDTIDEEKRKEFIQACKKLHDLKHFAEKFIDSYKLASNWCAEKTDEA